MRTSLSRFAFLAAFSLSSVSCLQSAEADLGNIVFRTRALLAENGLLAAGKGPQSHIAAASSLGNFELFALNTVTKKMTAILSGNTGRKIQHISWSPDGTYLAAVSNYNSEDFRQHLHIWDFSSGAPQALKSKRISRDVSPCCLTWLSNNTCLAMSKGTRTSAVEYILHDGQVDGIDIIENALPSSVNGIISVTTTDDASKEILIGSADGVYYWVLQDELSSVEKIIDHSKAMTRHGSLESFAFCRALSITACTIRPPGEFISKNKLYITPHHAQDLVCITEQESRIEDLCFNPQFKGLLAYIMREMSSEDGRRYDRLVVRDLTTLEVEENGLAQTKVVFEQEYDEGALQALDWQACGTALVVLTNKELLSTQIIPHKKSLYSYMQARERGQRAKTLRRPKLQPIQNDTRTNL